MITTDTGQTLDPQSGTSLERNLFKNRLWIALGCALLTVVLGLNARFVRLNASFDAAMPQAHPFVQNFLRHASDLQGSGNTLKIIVETAGGSIISPEYIETLKRMNDEIFLLPGVDRAYMKSLWTPATRWTGVTEDGFVGGPVMPENYDGSKPSLRQLSDNVVRSGEIGRLVASDMTSSIILVPLLERDPDTAQPLDYGRLSRQIEAIRDRYQSDTVSIRIVGFAQLVGDLIRGLHEILVFFAISIGITTAAVFLFTRCVRSTGVVVVCSLIAVVWLLGLLPMLGFSLDPYSILVPFLVFAIGISHGAQKMNGVMQDIGRGMDSLGAARMTFRRLFKAGFTALVCDAVGFAVLFVIGIATIRNLAMIASMGMAILIVTNLILLPVLLSFVGVSAKAAHRSLDAERAILSGEQRDPVWRFLAGFAAPRRAAMAITAAVLLGVAGWAVGLDLQIGDLDRGAAELRADSRYNRDNAYLIGHYATSNDVMVVMVETPANRCNGYKAVTAIDRLEGQLRAVPGVEATRSFAGLSRIMATAMNEGSPLWYEISPNEQAIASVLPYVPRELVNQHCDFLALYINLADHKATTLNRVVASVEAFARVNDSADARFLLAAGSAGIDAAANQAVEAAGHTILFYVYGSVMLLSLFTFRSWRAVLVAVLPLILTSILAQAIMVMLGIGVKVATLPVIALGVGIGVDYALYILSVTMAQLNQGVPLAAAYHRALLFTGKVVCLTGFTLSIAVGTWIFSPIKFQADMGVLLAFMFAVNMIGALVLIPALSYWLLPRGAQGAGSRGRIAGDEVLSVDRLDVQQRSGMGN